MLILNVRVPGEIPRRVMLDRPLLTFGRSSTNDVPLADRTLSRVHAKVENRSGSPVLVDLGSRNGTSLNGYRISEPIPLSTGDRINLGETTIDVLEESATRVVVAERDTPAEVTLFRSASDLVKPHLRGWDPQKEAGADELGRLNAQLRILNEVSVEFLSDIPLNRLLSLVVEKVFAYLAPDRGLLMLASESGELRPEVVKYAPGVDPTDIRLSKTLIQSVVEGKNGVLLIDTVHDMKLAAAESIRLTGVTSCIAAPLLAEDRVIGLIYLEVRLGRKSFTEEDLRLLSSLANTAAIKIQNLKLQEQAIAKQRIEREMALAWDIQRRLLPDKAPELPHTELFGRAVPSRTVSGDYYDFYERANGATDIVVADVCGKGMGASILAASVQAAFQVWAGENFPPDRLCAGLNDLVFRRTSPEKFITFFHVLYEPDTGSITYTNAGHNPGILIRSESGEHQLLHAHGMPLGLFPGKSYSSGTLTLGPGDILVLYTDGVTEAANADDDEFGIERLIEVARSCRTLPLQDVETAVNAALAEFVAGTPYHDDRTLVLLRRS
ncbi:MAG: SpoIIE family protein phosphatase [Thermoanaerobaculia bacterium]